MTMKIWAAFLISGLLLTGCATDPRVDMFTEQLADEKVATLLPFSNERGMAIIRVDGKSTGSCVTNCMFFRPVRVVPGTHELDMVVNLVNTKDNRPILPADRVAQASPAERSFEHTSLFTLSTKLKGQYTFEAGKRYRLEFAFKSADDTAPYVWWEAVP